jgi:hypothetical protein
VVLFSVASFKDKLTDWMAQRRAKECDHRNVSHSGQFCPDCGHKVCVEWAFIRCAQCNVKRPPFRQPGVHNYKAEVAKPMQKFCKNCGVVEFTVLKKQKIDAYELLFALPVKQIDPDTERKPLTATAGSTTGDAFIPAPIQVQPETADMLPSGLAHSYNSRAHLKTSPYNWQPNRQVSATVPSMLRPSMPFTPPK